MMTKIHILSNKENTIKVSGTRFGTYATNAEEISISMACLTYNGTSSSRN